MNIKHGSIHEIPQIQPGRANFQIVCNSGWGAFVSCHCLGGRPKGKWAANCVRTLYNVHGPMAPYFHSWVGIESWVLNKVQLFPKSGIYSISCRYEAIWTLDKWYQFWMHELVTLGLYICYVLHEPQKVLYQRRYVHTRYEYAEKCCTLNKEVR